MLVMIHIELIIYPREKGRRDTKQSKKNYRPRAYGLTSTSIYLVFFIYSLFISIRNKQKNKRVSVIDPTVLIVLAQFRRNIKREVHSFGGLIRCNHVNFSIQRHKIFLKIFFFLSCYVFLQEKNSFVLPQKNQNFTSTYWTILVMIS